MVTVAIPLGEVSETSRENENSYHATFEEGLNSRPDNTATFKIVKNTEGVHVPTNPTSEFENVVTNVEHAGHVILN